MLVDALYRMYSGLQGASFGIGDDMVREATQLCDRLIAAERQAFRTYLKSPDRETLQLSKSRLERIRQLGQKADLRQKRRVALAAAIEG